MVAAVCQFAGAAPNRDGLITGISGKWFDEATGAQVHFGGLLAADTRVRCQGEGSLSVWMSNVGRPVSIACAGENAVTRIGDVRAANGFPAQAAEQLRKIWDVVAPRLSKEPNNYVAAVSRGYGTPTFEEAVVAVKDGRVDLAPAMRDFKAGSYKVVLFPVTERIPDLPAETVEYRPGSAAWGQGP